MRPGGVLMSDDIQDNMEFADFCAGHGLRPYVIQKAPNYYAGILREALGGSRSRSWVYNP
jgi:hypothetical protein